MAGVDKRKHLLAVATHSNEIYIVELDTSSSTSPKLALRHSLALEEQPSWIALSPVHSGLMYTTSWVNDKLFVVGFDDEKGLRLLGEKAAGGGGPTYVEPTKDGKAVLSVHYRTGELVYHPLTASGLFESPTPSPNHIHKFDFPHSEVTHARQECVHPHHIIPFGDDWLVLDLGSDAIWRMRWEGDGATGGWSVIKRFSCNQYNGPRHGVFHPDGEHLYVVNEVASSLSVMRIPSDISTSSESSTLKTVSVLPPYLHDVANKGPFDLIPSSIHLLPPLLDNNSTAPPEAPLTLLVSNRNAPEDLSPEGDTFVEFSVDATNPSTLSEPTFYHGPGRHLRGVAVGPHESEDKSEINKYVVVMARDAGPNGGGFSVYERRPGGGKLVPVLMNQLEMEVPKPVGAFWLPQK